MLPSDLTTPLRTWARPPLALIGLAIAAIPCTCGPNDGCQVGSVGSAKAADVVPEPAGGASPSLTDLASLSGTWSVTGTSDPTDGCSAFSLAYQWIMTVQQDGTASVTALGATGFPALDGTVSLAGSTFSATFDGYKDAGLTFGGRSVDLKERSTFKITGSETKFTGSRTWSGFTVSTDGSALPQVCRWSISGKHL
jgi:hypothetical protein